jgi:transcriptional regulator with XRE-family HTH domain
MAVDRDDHAGAALPESVPPQLGQRLRRIREQSGQGLRTAARAIGISASSLSALENNRAGVSLRRIQQVASHYGLHVSDLLAPDAPARHGESEPEIVRAWAGSVPGVERGTGVLYQFMACGQGHAIQPYLISFPPGASYGDDSMGHPGEEFAFVIFGTVELLVDDRAYLLQQGDVIRFSSVKPHAFRNPSTNGISLLIGAATPPF